ncbi:MAG: PQQ-binding-like beta-propeller repeat protein [Arhodomonas sp.]|nr:PQQ-binding-like beta-propeller repeat protein [Arhodomonas sp.]
MARLLTLLAIGVLLAGCGSPDAFEAEPAAAVEVVGELQPQRAWSRDVGAAAGLQDRLTPAYAGGRLFVASAGGRVMALDPETGRTLWSRELGRSLSGGPAADEELVVIGSREGRVIALSAEDGATCWISAVTSEVLAPAALGTDTVVARSNDGRVFALERDSGERRWIYDRNVPTLSIRGYGAPVIPRVAGGSSSASTTAG